MNFLNKINPFLASTVFLLIIVLLEFITILYLNNFKFIYTLDDPYIHFRMAENILRGHYGINLYEYSAPSSSIIWPFIIAVMFSIQIFEYSALLINISAAIGTIYIYLKVLELSINSEGVQSTNIFFSFLLIMLILATNLIGIIFTGMEHSLQVLFASLLIYHLLKEIKSSKLSNWLVFAVIFGPLIRYENLGISIFVIFYFLVKGYLRQSIFSLLMLSLFVIGFSTFLNSIGLHYLPNSIISKSNISFNLDGLVNIYKNISRGFDDDRGIFFFVGLLFFVYKLFFGNGKLEEKALSALMIFSIISHMAFGKIGYYHRYEIYLTSILILGAIYLFRIQTNSLLRHYQKKPIKVILFLFVCLIIWSKPYIKDLGTIPLASNNIYEQQYQMHRFVKYFYKKPVGIIDLGLVSYQNDNYILDFEGLASMKSLVFRKKTENPEWMENMALEHNVKLIMIYDSWFSKLPSSWEKIGELTLGKKRITPADEKVTFYTTDASELESMRRQLFKFKNTLPGGATFVFNK